MIRTIVVLAFLLAAAPALAADGATIGCVETSIDAATLNALKVNSEQNAHNSGGTLSYRPEVVSGVQAAARACQQKLGWSDPATEAATFYTVAHVAWPILEQVAHERGLDSDALAAHYNALPAEQRHAALTDDLLRALANAALAAGEIKDENASTAGAVFGMLSLLSSNHYLFLQN